MKPLARMLMLSIAALVFTACNTSPPRPRHVGADDYMAARTGSEYLGESADHAFRKRPDGAIIYTDTEDLPAAEQAKVRSTEKAYTGEGSKVRRH